MLKRCVCVSLHNQDYPTKDEIRRTFRTYGEIENIISHDTFKDHFFIEFDDRQSAVRCFKDRLSIFKYDGYIVELKDKSNEDQGLHGGREDPNLPSIVDLNDDCISHLLSFLQEENATKFVCVRIRRLCMLLWRKERRFTVGRRFEPCLDRLYHAGDYATHLSLYEIQPYAYDFMFSICKNLKYLALFNITFEREEGNDIRTFERIDLQQVKKIDSVTELELHQVKKNDISVLFSNNSLKLEKLCIRIGNIPFTEIPKMSSLTTIMLPGTKIDVGQFLQRFPQTKVLACTLDGTFTPIPGSNTLQELFVVITENRSDDLVKIRKSCPQLRHLRVDGDNFLKYGVSQFLPLDGLHLSNLEIDESDLIEISAFANDLKIFFLTDFWIYRDDDDVQDDEDDDDEAYAKVLTQFKKLEITSWEIDCHGDIDSFLMNWPANAPLKIITESPLSAKQKLLSPSCEWVPNFVSLFGQFSIYTSNDDEDNYDDDSDSEFDDISSNEGELYDP